MKNIKLEKNLVGSEWWKKCTVVTVAGVAGAQPLSANMSASEKENVVQSWKTIAVLQADASKPFHVGFISDDVVLLLKHPIETLNGKFGMRVGGGDLKVFAIDPTVQEDIVLSLVEIVAEDDERYNDLPLY